MHAVVMKASMAGAIVAAVLCLGGASSQRDPRASYGELEARISGLEAEVSELTKENENLRQLLSITRTQAKHELFDVGGWSIMELEDLAPVDVSADIDAMYSEADRLVEEATLLREAAEKDDSKRRKFTGQATRMEREAKSLVVRAERLEEEGSGEYWLYGWDGRRDIILCIQTRKSTARELVIGNFIAYSGKEIATALGHRFEEDYSSVLVSGWKVAHAPGQHRVRPRRPVWEASTWGTGISMPRHKSPVKFESGGGGS